MYETISAELTDKIYVITINRPDKLNALNKTVIRELGEAVDEVYENPLFVQPSLPALAAGLLLRVGYSWICRSQ